MNCDEDHLNILILYDSFSTGITAVSDYLLAFQQMNHNIFYSTCTNANSAEPFIDLNYFDVIIFHYSIRLCYTWHLTEPFFDKISAFSGLKIGIAQDEYDNTNQLKENIKKLGLDIFYSCVPEAVREKVYPKSEFANTEFHSVLTGYISDEWRIKYEKYKKPISSREKLISYRGRDLPYWYGRLGQEKSNIAKLVSEQCEKLGEMNFDISIKDEDRIYGDDWFKFMGNSVATLGTESGSEVFDWDGSAKVQLEAFVEREPDVTFGRVLEQFPDIFRNPIKMNQISPRIFEAIYMGSLLVLFEGEYSGVVKENTHFLSLKKDGSNLADIIKKIKDFDFVQEMTNRAFDDVVGSKLYTYQSLVSKIEEDIGARKISRRFEIVTCVTGAYVAEQPRSQMEDYFPAEESDLAITCAEDIYRGVPTGNILRPPVRWLEPRQTKSSVDKRRLLEDPIVISKSNWYPGHDIQDVLKEHESDFYASQVVDDDLSNQIFFKFDTQMVFVALEIIGYDRDNYIKNLSISVGVEGKYSSESEFNVDMESSNHRLSFPEPIVGDSLLLKVEEIVGQQRILIRKIKLWGFNSVARIDQELDETKDDKSLNFRIIRRLFRLLPARLKSEVKSVLKKI